MLTGCVWCTLLAVLLLVLVAGCCFDKLLLPSCRYQGYELEISKLKASKGELDSLIEQTMNIAETSQNEHAACKTALDENKAALGESTAALDESKVSNFASKMMNLAL